MFEQLRYYYTPVNLLKTKWGKSMKIFFLKQEEMKVKRAEFA